MIRYYSHSVTCFVYVLFFVGKHLLLHTGFSIFVELGLLETLRNFHAAHFLKISFKNFILILLFMSLPSDPFHCFSSLE